MNVEQGLQRLREMYGNPGTLFLGDATGSQARLIPGQRVAILIDGPYLLGTVQRHRTQRGKMMIKYHDGRRNWIISPDKNQVLIKWYDKMVERRKN